MRVEAYARQAVETAKATREHVPVGRETRARNEADVAAKIAAAEGFGPDTVGGPREGATGATQPLGAPGREEREEALRERLKELEESLGRATGRNLKFAVRDEEGEMQVEVRDADSDRVVFTFPPEELMRRGAEQHHDLGGLKLDKTF